MVGVRDVTFKIMGLSSFSLFSSKHKNSRNDQESMKFCFFFFFLSHVFLQEMGVGRLLRYEMFVWIRCGGCVVIRWDILFTKMQVCPSSMIKLQNFFYTFLIHLFFFPFNHLTHFFYWLMIHVI